MTLFIVTPVFGGVEAGSVSLAYHNALTAVRVGPGIEVSEICLKSTDLVRCRSAALHEAFVKGHDVLFWDADVVGPPGVVAAAIRGLLDSGHELVGASYPMKREGSTLVAHEIDPGVTVGSCHPAKYIGAGFTLVRRTLVERLYAWMAEHEPRLRFKYLDGEGKLAEAPAAFMLVCREDAILLSEDFSLCERVSRLGTRPWLYTGVTLGHVGSKVYR